MTTEFIELIEYILENTNDADSTDNTIQSFSSYMPLMDRNIYSAVKTVKSNFTQRNCKFLVCCGAPGIGKTRYGVELFEHLEIDFGQSVKLDDFDDNLSVDTLQIYLDFGQSVKLDDFDDNLSVDSIIAIRIAFKFFADNRDFIEFRTKIYQHFKSDLLELQSIFNLDNIIQNIRKYRQLRDEDNLFLFLHIDEIQTIFEYEISQETRKGFFKNLLQVLALYTRNGINFIQTFLSGTALQEVSQLEEPASCSFEYIDCPLLSIRACINIVDHFAMRYGDPGCRWSLNRPFMKILNDACGLPRAIEYILDEVLGIDHQKARIFFEGQYPEQSSNCFINIATRLDENYAITNFVEKNKNLALILLKNCLRRDRILRTQKVLGDDANCTLTYWELERDHHIILGSSIVMPVYFIYLYNKVLKVADDTFLRTFTHEIEWQVWEHFVTHFEAFKTNLLVESGTTTATLGEIYPGALGTKKTLSLKVKLRHLDVAYLQHQFPKTHENLYCTRTSNSYSWNEAVIFRNADSDEFADSFVQYDSEKDDTSYIFCLHHKWMWGKTLLNPLHLGEVISVHNKNKKVLKKYGSEKLKKQRIITIFFTLKTINPNLSYSNSFHSTITDDILVICKETFEKYFGEPYSSDFNLLFLNANYTPVHTLKNVLGAAMSDSPEELRRKRPFRSCEDFSGRVTHNNTDGIRTKIRKLSYTPFYNYHALEEDYRLALRVQTSLEEEGEEEEEEGEEEEEEGEEEEEEREEEEEEREEEEEEDYLSSSSL